MDAAEPPCTAGGRPAVVHSDPEILSGTPVFAGTQVPVQTFIDWLMGGYTVDAFIDNFPTVRREQVSAFFSQGVEALLPGR
jgi:uncharacterized protein (DUF433 family)